MKRVIRLCAFALLLAGCGGFGPPVIAGLSPVAPSPTPAIHSPTPPFVPSPTASGTAPTASPTRGRLPATPTLTPATASATPSGSPGLSLEIVGCNTSVDIRHQMGEVTNAFPRLQNAGPQDLTNVCATLSGSDEAREHPDKTVCIPSLPAGYQVILKLTIDTGLGEDTSIQVDVVTDQGNLSISRLSCTAIGMPGSVPDEAGVLQPIP